MRLCLDEHSSPQIEADLRDLGHDVTSVKERQELACLPDAELLALMRAERRALLTENVADFAPLIRQLGAAGEDHFGIIYSPSASMPRSRATIGVFVASLRALLEGHPGDQDFVNQTEWLTPRAAE